MLCIVFALDDSKIVVDGKCIVKRVVFQGMMEVLPAGGCRGRDDGDALYDPVKGERFVLCVITVPYFLYEFGVFPDKSGEGSLAFLFETAEGEIAVDVIDIELQAKNGVEIDRYVDQYIDVIGEALSGEGLKIADTCGSFSPGFCLHFCDDGIGDGILFDEIEVMVIFICAKGMVRDVCDDPKAGFAECFVQRLRDGSGKLRKAERLCGYQSRSLSGLGMKFRKA